MKIRHDAITDLDYVKILFESCYQNNSPGAKSILHKNLRQRKLVFQWVLYGPKGRNSPGTRFFFGRSHHMGGGL